MFTTTQPITIVAASGANPAVAADHAFLSVHYAPIVTAGKIQDTVFFRAQRGVVDANGNFTAVGPTVDKGFSAPQLAAARAANSTLDNALTALVAALQAVAPELGL